MLPATHLDAAFFTALASIVVIDLLLAGDNAVVIAMAVRPLPADQRRKGIAAGAAAAVLVRVILTFFVARLLAISFVKLVGGLFVLWIAVKLFAEAAGEEEEHRDAATAWDAVKLIVVADVTMSLDNMLAVGGASHGNPVLLALGLGLSIPFVVFTSDLLSRLMDRWPALVYVGAAILGKVGAEMILTDPFTVARLHPSDAVVHAAEAALAVGLVVFGKARERRAGAA